MNSLFYYLLNLSFLTFILFVLSRHFLILSYLNLSWCTFSLPFFLSFFLSSFLPFLLLLSLYFSFSLIQITFFYSHIVSSVAVLLHKRLRQEVLYKSRPSRNSSTLNATTLGVPGKCCPKNGYTTTVSFIFRLFTA